jgi:hypothetical protein
MKKHFPFALLATALLSSASFAAPKPAAKPTKKSAQKPATLIREVLGTQQLVGYEGHLGETFTLGKDSPLNFTLRSASYNIGRVNIGGNSHFAGGDEKLLVLRFTVQNPRKTAFYFSTSYLTFKAVDANGVTRTYVGDVAREVTGESMNFLLQPGQKVDAYTAIKVAAFGEVPKLIVQSAYHPTPIVRYDLRGKVARLPAPFADPTDALGANALKLVPAKTNVFYPVADRLDVRIEGIAYTTDPLGGRAPETGKRYCVANATVQNRSANAINFSQSYFRADLKDADGEKVDYNTSIRKGSRDEEAGHELQTGETAKVRFYWTLPAADPSEGQNYSFFHSRQPYLDLP